MEGWQLAVSILSDGRPTVEGLVCMDWTFKIIEYRFAKIKE